MNNEFVIKNANININLYKKYKMFSYDFVFFYAIVVLYFTITKGVSISQIMYLNGISSIFFIIFYFFLNSIVNKLNLKLSMVLGNFSLLINILIYILGNSFLSFVIGNIFFAFGFTLKNISESSVLYSSLKKINKVAEFSKIEGKANSKYYYYDACSSIISGFLFIFNNYLPMILCFINIFISFVISTKFHNVDTTDENELFTIKDMLVETKEIFKSNRLKSLYLFSFLFTGIVTVSTTLYKAIILDIGIKDEYSTFIIFFVSIFVGIGAKKIFNVEKITKNKTLKILSITYILALLGIGIIGIISKLNIYSLSFMFLLFVFIGFIQGAYRIALKKYILSFTTHKIRNKITSTYYIFENLGTTILSFIIGILLNYTSNSIATVIFSIVSFAFINLALYYMKEKLGLHPENYSSVDLNKHL